MHVAGLLSSMVLAFVASATSPTTSLTRAPTPTGRLHLTFAERSPLSALDVVLSRMDMNSLSAKNAASLEYDLARLSFEVVVPPTYKPDVPHGLFVWLGVSDFSPAWLNVLARHKLILVVANTRSGHPALYGPPLDAVHNMKKLYNIDADRVYVSGFSAGGCSATMMVRGFPEVFRGGLFLMGGYFYVSYKGQSGRREPTIEESFPRWKGPLDEVRKEMKLVIIKGGNDTQWTAQEGRCDYEALRLDGFTRVSYFEVPGLGHRPPDASWFENGITALDQSLPLTPPVTGPTTEPHPLPSQIAQAQRILAAAKYYLELKLPQVPEEMKDRIRKSYQDKARKYLRRVLEEYPTTPAAAKARELLQQMDRGS